MWNTWWLFLSTLTATIRPMSRECNRTSCASASYIRSPFTWWEIIWESADEVAGDFLFEIISDTSFRDGVTQLKMNLPVNFYLQLYLIHPQATWCFTHNLFSFPGYLFVQFFGAIHVLEGQDLFFVSTAKIFRPVTKGNSHESGKIENINIRSYERHYLDWVSSGRERVRAASVISLIEQILWFFFKTCTHRGGLHKSTGKPFEKSLAKRNPYRSAWQSKS